MAAIDITSGTAGAYGSGELQLQGKVQMTSTLTYVTDNLDTASTLKLSTTSAQFTSPLRITTDDPSDMYLDCEDGATNNRFNITRNTASQQVNLNFASNPGGSTTIVGAIRTYVDGVNLSEVMAFREDGNVGIGTTSPGAKLDIHSASNVITQFNRTGAGKSWIQFQQAGTGRWNTGYDNTNGNYTIYDAVNAADRMVVTNAGNVGIGTITPGTSLGGAYGLVLNSGAASDNQIRLQNNTTGSNSTDGGLLSISGSLLYLWNYEASDTIFGTNSAERMRITSTGNVGIGTSTPNSKLEISAGVDIYGENITSSSGVATTTGISMGSFVGNPGGSNGSVYIASAHNHSATAQSSMVLYTHTGSALTEKMRINPLGSVGIGTTSPSAKLHVLDSIPGTLPGAVLRVGNSGVGYIARVILTDETTADGNIVLKGDGVSAANQYIGFGLGGSIDTLKLTGDNYIRLAAGTGGIQFNGDTAAANALDDYEEGTWTMGISFGGGSTGVTYNLNFGAYTKIGRQVTVTGFLQLSSKGSSTGSASITGLPFTIAGNLNRLSPPSLWLNNLSFTDQFQGFCNQGTTQIEMYQITNAGVASTLNDTNFSNNTEIMLSATYYI